MAEATVAVDAESMVCETKGASPLEETEPKSPENLEEGKQAVSVEASAPDSSDQKRKLADLEPFENDEAPAKKQHIDVSDSISENPAAAEDEVTVASDVVKQEIEVEETVSSGHPEAEKPIPVEDAAASDGSLVSSAVDGNVVEEQPEHVRELDDAGLEQVKLEAEPVGNGQISSTENTQYDFVDDLRNPSPSAPHQGSFPHSGHQTSFDLSVSRKIEVPNNKVGVLIGKSGETIRHLQINSGAKIQITRDGDNDPHSSLRHVELTGTIENINKAEQLIKDVIAEANAGGSPSLVARGFSTPQSGGEQIEMQIPSDKVGMIIGKGGETIKNMQTKTGARIQLLPQNILHGDTFKERTVRITGYIKQVECARELIKDVMIQKGPARSSPRSNTYNNQHVFRPPRGPAPPSQWGPRGPNPTHQTTGYNHQQQRGGTYPPQTTQYPQSHASYSQQQPPPRANWEQQRPSAAPLQSTPPSANYGYYNTQPSNPMPTPTPAPINYNYGHSQAPDNYGHQAPSTQQTYGHGYTEPNMYAQQQPMASQPGVYGQPSSYGPPRGPQPQDPPMYQGPPPSQYPSNPSMQQPYPYGSSAPAQQAMGYSQQPPASYPQSSAGYAQPAPQSGGGGGGGGYSQYPASQPGYGDQTAQANVSYGYQGGAPDAGYAGNVQSSGYAVQQQPAGNQTVYAQPQMNPSGYYDPAMVAQSGHGAVPAAPAGYGNTVSPQAGYGGQYDATTMYGSHQ